MSNTSQFGAFADVVTMYAWQQPGEREGLWTIYADVSFTTARVGGDEETPVRFRMSLRRVQVSLIVPETDMALTLNPGSIERDDRGVDRKEAKKKVDMSSADTESAESGGKVSAAVTALMGKFGFEAKAKKSASSTKTASESVETTEEIFRMKITANAVSSKKAAWKVEASETDRLDGSPWKANKARAVMMDSEHAFRGTGMEAGGVRFEVVCAREDLIFENIEIKEPKFMQMLTDSTHKAAKQAAITQYLRDEVQRTGLFAQNIEDPYGKITLIDHLVESVNVR